MTKNSGFLFNPDFAVGIRNYFHQESDLILQRTKKT